MEWGSPGRATFPVSVSRLFCSPPRRLQARGHLWPKNHNSVVGHGVDGG